MNHKTNLGIRAVLHTARKWKKTLLVFFLLLAITTLVMSGLAIADAQEEQSEELRGVTGASFTVNANNGYTLQPVTDEMIEEIAAIDGVESYNTSHWTIVNLYHQDTLMKGTDEREYVADLFYGTGCFDSEYSPLFLSGALRLTEGCHVTEGNSGIILYEGLAEKYGLSLGDTLEIKNGNPDDPLVECEIAGLFEVIADDDDEQATMAKPSTLYDYENYIFTDMDTMSAVSAPYTASNGNGITSVDFFVSDAAKLESIVQEVQNSTSIDWNSYYITVSNEVYERGDYCGEHGTDYPDPLHVHPQPETGNRHFTGGRYRQACGDSPICAGNPADRGGGLPAGVSIEQASGGNFGDTVRQGGRECHRHAGTLYAGGCRGRHFAGGGGAGFQHFHPAVKAQADFGANGIRPSTP